MQQSPTKLCKQCSTIIPFKAKKCPNCQSDLRSWPRRHPILTTFLLLFVLPVVITSATSSSPDTTQKNSIPSSPRISPSRLNASVTLVSDAGTKITNNEQQDWVGCSFLLYSDGENYSVNNDGIKAGSFVAIGYANYLDSRGRKFERRSHTPGALTITCNRKDGSKGSIVFSDQK
jgi:hypothetical protein